MADVQDLGSCAAMREGSNPSGRMLMRCAVFSFSFLLKLAEECVRYLKKSNSLALKFKHKSKRTGRKTKTAVY